LYLGLARPRGAVQKPSESLKKEAGKADTQDGRPTPGRGTISMSMHDGRSWRLLSVLTIPPAVRPPVMVERMWNEGGLTWPIAADSTPQPRADSFPFALSADTPPSPNEVTLYEQDGYSAWQVGLRCLMKSGPSLRPLRGRAECRAPSVVLFREPDAHISDKESPLSHIYVGWSCDRTAQAPLDCQRPYSPPCSRRRKSRRCRPDDQCLALGNRHSISELVLGRPNQQLSVQTRLRWFIDVHGWPGHHSKLRGSCPRSRDHRLSEAVQGRRVDKTSPGIRCSGQSRSVLDGNRQWKTRDHAGPCGGDDHRHGDDPNPASGGRRPDWLLHGRGSTGRTVYGDIVGGRTGGELPDPPTVVADVEPPHPRDE